MVKKVFLGIGVLGIFFTPIAFAASTLKPPLPPGISSVNNIPVPITNIQTDVPALIEAALLWMFWILIAISIIMFLWGGYRYVTSQGEPEKVSEANKTLLYAAVGVIVAIVAFGLPIVISSFFYGVGYTPF